MCLPLSSSITPLHPPFLYKCREQISESLRRRYTTSLTSVVSLQTKRPRRLSLSHTLSSKQRREKQRKGKLSPSPFIAYFTCLAEHRLSRGHSFAWAREFISLHLQIRMGRAPCCEKVGLKRGRWTAEEDEILNKYIQANGEGSWRSLPKNAGKDWSH